MLTRSNDVVDGPCKLLKQTVLRSSVGGCQWPGKPMQEFYCWVYRGLLEAYHLRQAATGVAGVVTSKRGCNLTCFVETCAAEATFLLYLLKASLPPPKYHCKSIVWQPRIWYFFFLFWGGPEAPLYSRIIFTILYICTIYVTGRHLLLHILEGYAH